MFRFFFKYPFTVFSKGRFVLLGTWPGWLLPVLIVLAAAGLGWLIRSRMATADPKLRGWRAGVIWGLQSALVALLLVLLWEPAITVAELSSQQNIIAVLVDDSRSMAIADSGGDGKVSREAAAVKALRDGVLTGLQKRFQTRVYRLTGKDADGTLAQVSGAQVAGGQGKALDSLQPVGTATHIGSGLKQLATETADLPVGAVVLLSDGSENSGGGIGLDALNALRNRRLPVHTIGFGKEQVAHDVAMDEVSVPSTAIAESRMGATVNFHQRGYRGGKSTLMVRDGDKVLAAKEVDLAADGVMQSETVFFNAGGAAARNLEFSLAVLPGEENLQNNAMVRPVTVSDAKRRILYVEGEPRWEFKFIRRAEDDDKSVQVVSMLRTTENKIYRQGISDPKELEGGFPSRPEDLFGYQGIILGSVEAGYFTPSQQELLREFVDRRGGGLLFLGGRFSLGDGGWGGSSVTDLLPTFLPGGRNTFHRDPATAELTPAGVDSPIMRLVDDPAKNVDRWKKLTYMMDYQDAGSPKPGATVLAEMAKCTALGTNSAKSATVCTSTASQRAPLLVTQNFGHGRTAVMATSGTWRWQMSQPLGDPAHDQFWQQLLRWLVADSPGRVVASMPTQMLMDEGRVHLSATVRNQEYMPAADAKVTAHFIAPDGASTLVDMSPTPNEPGVFQVDWTAEKAGSYLAEVTAQGAGRGANAAATQLGRDVIAFQRTDGVAENFHTEQNRDLLEKLSAATGGRYWKPEELAQLPSEISYSEAGISVRDTKELWNMPVVFLVLLALVATEWLLRRKWGIV